MATVERFEFVERLISSRVCFQELLPIFFELSSESHGSDTNPGLLPVITWVELY